MSVEIETKQKTSSGGSNIATINSYLNGVIGVMGKKSTMFGANRAAKAYMKENPLQVDDREGALKAIGRLEEIYSEKTTDVEKGKKRTFLLGASAAVTCVVSLAATQIEPTLALAMLGGTALLAAETAVGGKTSSVSKEEYIQAKHALFALKKLQKTLNPGPSYRDEVRALYASGLGNPGGMITALNLKRDGGR